MLILAIESSATAASAALVRDGALTAQYIQHSGLTHSRTLLPMVENLLDNTETSLSDVDAVACSRGPGSFTGVRIGVSTVKGLCWGAMKPAIGVSTLEAMAWNGLCAGESGLICCCMDARRGQLYNALFEIRGGAPSRLCDDRAVSLGETADELSRYDRPALIVGDGAALFGAYLTERGIDHRDAPGNLVFQSAWGVAMAAAGMTPAPARELIPVYLRLSQAERERQATRNNH